jgi:cobalt/nickel transport system permease protein
MSIAFPLGDRYRAGDSLLHQLDARVKVVGALAFIFAATLVPTGHWSAFALLAILLMIAVAAARLPPLLVLRRSALALPFLLVALPLLFTRPGDVLFTVPAVFWRWHATDAGLIAVGSVLAKSLLSVAAAVVLTATTPSLDLLRGLQGLGVPRIIVSTVSFMYRYLSVIGEEAVRLLRARDCRSVRVGRRSGGSLLWRSRVTGNMVGSLFLRSYERSERVFDAMTARGYDGELRSFAAATMRAVDWGLLLALATVLVGIEVYARL